MARRYAPLLWLLLLLLIVAGSWFLIAPRRAYDRFLQAIAFGSKSGLAETVDVPALRQHFFDDVRGALSRRSDFHLRGAAVDSFLTSAAEVALNPSGLASLVTGFGTRTPTDAADTLHGAPVVTYQYRSLSRMDVRIRAAEERESRAGILTFTRTGTTWRLSRIWSEQLVGTQGAP